MSHQPHLSGKTALVTGASRGIGRATALALAKAGAQVLVHYGSGEKEATAVVLEIQGAGGRAERVAADLRAAEGPHHQAERVRAPYFLVQQLLPVMNKGSSVILLSSLAAHSAIGNLSAYSATKGAIDTLVKHFAAALGERGIRVNAVAPGVVPTEMSNFAKTQQGRDFTVGLQALKRLATPEDIAAVISFLASDEAQWITGDTLRVDGGSKL